MTTDDICAQDNLLEIHKCEEPHSCAYHWFQQHGSPDTSRNSGLEAETGEFLAGLVAMYKPLRILETGTRMGISTRYLAEAQRRWVTNGYIVTVERCGQCFTFAKTRLKRYSSVVILHASSLDCPLMPFDCALAGYGMPAALTSEMHSMAPSEPWDMMYLDSEPQYRYRELERFWPCLRDGGMVVIHDLNRLDCEPFLPLPPWFMQEWAAHRIAAMCFPTCTGLTVLQKRPRLWSEGFRQPADEYARLRKAVGKVDHDEG